MRGNRVGREEFDLIRGSLLHYFVVGKGICRIIPTSPHIHPFKPPYISILSYLNYSKSIFGEH